MSEASEQIAVFNWALLQQTAIPELELLHASMNGAWIAGSNKKAKYALIRKYKLQGMKSGVPDIFLPVSRDGWHGMFIELKVGKNKPSDAQAKWLDALNEQGYCAVVCYGADEAIRVIKEYLEITDA